ncbi:Uncharacterised protein [Segatella copri]|nr:Uncharacterised protein [Segatella copri]
MIRQESLWLPDNIHSFMRSEHFFYCHISHVSLTCSSQTSIEGYFIIRSVRATLLKKFGCTLRPHRMTARWPLTYSI